MKKTSLILSLLLLLFAGGLVGEEKGLACSFLSSVESSLFFLIDSDNETVKELTSVTTSKKLINTLFTYGKISWEKGERGGEYGYFKYSLDRKTLRLEVRTIMPVIEDIMTFKPTDLSCSLVSHQELIAGYKKAEETFKKGMEMLMEDITGDNQI